MPGEIWAFLCPFLRKEVSAAANRIMGITEEALVVVKEMSLYFAELEEKVT